jgi:uncharacterized protein with HEPN domain
MRAPEADRVRVLHMLEAIRQLEHSASDISEQALDDDAMLRFGTVKLIEIIGEAANMLTKELRAEHPDVPWPLIIGMRHRLVHDYFRIDTAVVSETVHLWIPQLRSQLEAILADLPKPMNGPDQQ